MTQIKGYSLFSWPIFTFLFKKAKRAGGTKAKCVLALLWKCKIIVFISFKTTKKSHSNLVERLRLS